MDPIKQATIHILVLLLVKADEFYPNEIDKIFEKIDNRTESLTAIDYAYILNNTGDDFIHSFLKKHNVQRYNAVFYQQILTAIMQLRQYETMQEEIKEEKNRIRNDLSYFIFMHQTNLVKALRALFKEYPRYLKVYKTMVNNEPYAFPSYVENGVVIWLRPDPDHFAPMVDTPKKQSRTTPKIKKRKIKLSFGFEARETEATKRKETNEPITPEPKRRK